MASTTAVEKNIPTTRHELQRVPDSPAEDITFLRLPQVKTLTGLSKSSLYALIRAHTFPAPAGKLLGVYAGTIFSPRFSQDVSGLEVRSRYLWPNAG